MLQVSCHSVGMLRLTLSLAQIKSTTEEPKPKPQLTGLMATAAAVSLNVQDRSTTVKVPSYDVPHLMYYLKSINSLGPKRDDPTRLKAPQHLTDYANWKHLSLKDIRDIASWSARLAPDKTPAKDFVVCDANLEVCGKPGQSDAAFIEVSADFNVVSVGRGAVVAGSAKGIGKKFVLFYSPQWLKKFYTDPLAKVSRYHCVHCPGAEGPCGCQARDENCDRPGFSMCHILRSDEHNFKCDGCDDQRYVTGVLFKCMVCNDYGLCRRCYEDRQVHDLTHRFEEIVKAGATPILRNPRNWLSFPTPHQPQTSQKVPFTKGDVVTLKSLARADMDGKEATVLNVDVANQKAQIRMDGQDKTFRVKWANIEPVEDLDDSDEELE